MLPGASGAREAAVWLRPIIDPVEFDFLALD